VLWLVWLKIKLDLLKRGLNCESTSVNGILLGTILVLKTLSLGKIGDFWYIIYMCMYVCPFVRTYVYMRACIRKYERASVCVYLYYYNVYIIMRQTTMQHNNIYAWAGTFPPLVLEMYTSSRSSLFYWCRYF
jgi:hypothetical protein